MSSLFPAPKYRAFAINLADNAFSQNDDLGTLADTSSQRVYDKASEAFSVRVDYGIVGQSQNSDGIWRAFYVPIGSRITQDAALPGLLQSGPGTSWSSAAYSINRLGIKVGMAQTNNPSGSGLTTRAVMWTGATGNPITDLNSLLPPSSGWILNQAISINDNGFII